MSKRFTATEKWNDPWFRKLPPKAKLIWLYMVDSCDSAGFWLVDFELASFLIGYEVTEDDITPFINGRVVKHPDSWEIVKFVNFQYGNLSENCKAHKPILERVEKQRVSKGYPKGINTLVEVEVEVDKEVDKGGMGGNKAQHTKFVDAFSAHYKKMTGQRYNPKDKQYKLAATLIKDNGYDACVEKAKILAVMCQEGKIWFCKDGPADFTIEKLSSQWNSILAIEKLDESTIRNAKMAERILKRREENERKNVRVANVGGREVAGEALCFAGSEPEGRQEGVFSGGDQPDGFPVSCGGEGAELDDEPGYCEP
jgi:hypothetical protein